MKKIKNSKMNSQSYWKVSVFFRSFSFPLSDEKEETGKEYYTVHFFQKIRSERPEEVYFPILKQFQYIFFQTSLYSTNLSLRNLSDKDYKTSPACFYHDNFFFLRALKYISDGYDSLILLVLHIHKENIEIRTSSDSSCTFTFTLFSF